MKFNLHHGLALFFAGNLLLPLPADAGQEEPLLIKGDNTVIVNFADHYSAAYLQHFLLKYVTRQEDAGKYAIDFKPPMDRSASPNFPVMNGSEDFVLPEGKVAILVGQDSRIPEQFVSNAIRQRMANSKNGTVLVHREGNVIIAAKKSSEPWNLNPIRIFLDKAAGVRMYAPDGADGLEWVSMPRETSFEVNKLDIFMQPWFAKTTFSSGGYQRNATWLRMNTMVSEGLELRASHTITSYFPPDKYYDDHPQLYPMHANGARPKPIGGAWNPCFADPELSAKVAMDEVRLMLQGRFKTQGYLSFGIMDAHYDCKCEPCKKSLEQNGNAANLWYGFLNLVAKQCQKEFPDLYLTSYQYANVDLPTNSRIEPNIAIDAVIKSYRFFEQKDWVHLLQPAALGARWVVHDWNFQGVTPRIYSRQIASFLQWGAQNGMAGIYTEWSGHEYWYMSGAKYWVLRQLLSNPYQSTDVLWRQYCLDMFGDGWEEMYRFYDLIQQKHVTADKSLQRLDWPRQESAGYSEQDLQLQRQWLETAIEQTKTEPGIQKRLGAIMRYFLAHELLVRATAIPARLYHNFTVLRGQTGINKEALAFYANDDGSNLVKFEDYYDSKRTLAPDSNTEDRNSSLRFSYRNNYARALGTIIQSVKAEALEGVNLDEASRKSVEEVVERSGKIFKANLPKKYDRKRAKELRLLMEKVLWVPRLDSLPQFDGVLDDPVWKQATELTGWTMADLLIPTADGNETFGRIMRVKDHLVIGLECQQPKGIWAETPKDVHTGTRIWREASCEFFFGPPAETAKDQEYIQYIVNSLGAFRGFRKSQDNRKDVHCAVNKAEDGKSYTIELAVPLKVEGQYDYTQGRVFTFNVMRNPFYANTFNSKERIGWAPIFYTAGVPESRGMLVLE
ncbi:MAG: DUF4838 domain-containing protein [Planctomycetota bacterium]|nr:DUF4838 domain-containing protein [Planctomycetota bacterium]